MKPLVFLLIACGALVGCAHKRSAPAPEAASLSERMEAAEEQAKAEGCTVMSIETRKKILSLADPENFPGARYRRGPRRPASLEQETDCSHFVHQIYKRAGLSYGYRSSRDLKSAPEFEKISESEALPGDLMVFRSHVGIVDENGLIISATRKRRHQKSAITRMDKASFPGFRGRRYALRFRCHSP